jgi:mannose-6-phosphate isomerase-like protein (cupin superfamily)
MQTIEALIGNSTSSETITALGITITYHVPPEATNHAWALLEYQAPAHFRGPAPHWHAETSELFYVLDGMLGFTIGDQTITAHTGTSVRVLPGLPHTFFNPSSAPARFLVWLSPGTFANYFRDLVDLIQSEPTWPPSDPSKLQSLAHYDQHTAA